MRYTNDKIEKLIAERDAKFEEYNRGIQKEIEKERAKYTFSYKRLVLMIGSLAFMVFAFQLNKKVFPKTSIWSWEHYIGENTTPFTKNSTR